MPFSCAVGNFDDPVAMSSSSVSYCFRHTRQPTFVTRLSQCRLIHKSWYDGDWAYWAARRGKHPMVHIREATLLKRQRGRCPICRNVFDLHDSIERDHVRPMANGGLDVYDNLQVVHPTCHHRKTRWDKQGWCPVRPWRGETVGEALCELKSSGTVLKAGGAS